MAFISIFDSSATFTCTLKSSNCVYWNYLVYSNVSHYLNWENRFCKRDAMLYGNWYYWLLMSDSSVYSSKSEFNYSANLTNNIDKRNHQSMKNFAFTSFTCSLWLRFPRPRSSRHWPLPVLQLSIFDLQRTFWSLPLLRIYTMMQ